VAEKAIVAGATYALRNVNAAHLEPESNLCFENTNTQNQVASPGLFSPQVYEYFPRITHPLRH